MIDDWVVLKTGSSLHYFIGLVVLYHRYAPYIEMRIKPSCLMMKTYFRTDITIMVWTPALLKLFQYIKVVITSSPVLARYDTDKPTFLKTN